MKTTQAPQAAKGLQFQLDKQTLQVQIELSSLLRSLGAPTTLVTDAISIWENNLQVEVEVEPNPESELPLCYLPVSQIPQFIDQILDQLSSESRATALRFSEAFSTAEAQVNEVEILKRSNNPKVLGAVLQWMKNDPASYALHELMALQQKRTVMTAPTQAAQGAL
ncbi:hypothetical protein SBP02_18345 [Pseudomonas benzenivorans]|uniref:Uncharacterized protein n=1 Tax=Pseudomonas benzenivorans TaxID=556533 RepID=A0ABZ0PU33_9PSED|nr:hypothetical protein [Pseudomonas benzenivorans]WPC04693.1 hypothetical protein SBP02_18345 [Pseudomonas benzenivorans]